MTHDTPEAIVVWPLQLSTYGPEVDWREGNWSIPGYTMEDGVPYTRTDAITPAVAAEVLQDALDSSWPADWQEVWTAMREDALAQDMPAAFSEALQAIIKQGQTT